MTQYNIPVSVGAYLRFPRCHLPHLIPFPVSPRQFSIVYKHGQPLLRQRRRVVALAPFDGLERVQVVGNPPQGAIGSAPGVFPNYLAR
jgi:hypothetical protein